MAYSTLMVHLELGRSNAALLQVLLDVAERFGSEVIGIAGCPPLQMYYAEGFSVGIFEQEQEGIDDDIATAEAEFRKALSSTPGQHEWRSTTTRGSVADFIAQEARAADLVLTGVSLGDAFDTSRTVDTADLLLQVGRPVLLVPHAAPVMRLRHALVAWNDTRESRRAIVDALPLLLQAGRVTLGTIADQGDLAAARARLADVGRWLTRHGVAAEQVAAPTIGNDADALWALAQDLGADLVVAGAYGHSRLREWVMGGVTKNLLLSEDRYALLTH